MNETERIEKVIADAFIKLYNFKMETLFSIIEYTDSPDIRCEDPEGYKFNFEITLTEDRPKDIQAALGRSDHRSLKNLKKHLADLRNRKIKPKVSPLDRTSCLQGNVIRMIISRIQPKLYKDYGKNVALVIRDTSPVEWNWEMVIAQIKSCLKSKPNPYDKGIWIITYRLDKIFRIS